MSASPIDPSDVNQHLERAYDADPYPDFAFWFTHPDHLGMMARLMGVPTRDTANTRVLEIGCAVGGNLIPMAASVPTAQFVGVDLSGVQIEAARACAREAGLSNITFVHGDFRDVARDLGPFDHIICHGVFAWVDTETQGAILSFMHDRLARNGVAYVSYNTYPGHLMVDMVRRLARLHTAELSDPEQKIRESVAVTRWLHRRVRKNPNDWRATFLEKEIEAMQESGPSLILHDYLAAANNPLYFIDLVRMAEANGLGYLANASAWDMYLDNHDPEIVENLTQLGDMVLQQQYLDFIFHTRFRRTLLCRGEDLARPEILAERVTRFHIGSGLFEEPNLDGLAERMPVMVPIINRPPLTVSHPLLKVALWTLWHWGRRWPSFDELAIDVAAELERRGLEAELTSNPEILRARLAGQLLRAFFAEAVRFSLGSPPVARVVPERPATGRYQRLLASRNNPSLVNLGHECFEITPAARALLPVMDGTRTIDELRSFWPDGLEERLAELRQTGFILDPDLAAPFL
jgi:SAM-dependent methyltransferase